MRTIGPILGLIAVLSPSSISANSAPPHEWVGVWRGTIGSLPVQACLQQEASNRTLGAYFYLSKLGVITLGPVDPKNPLLAQWTEAPYASNAAAGPTWSSLSVTGNRLTGLWSGNGKELPIALTRLAQADASAKPCYDLAFSKPRAIPTTISKARKKMDGVRYTDVTANVGKHFNDVSISSFQLDGKTDEILSVNTALLLGFPFEAENSDYFGCMMVNIGSTGRDGQYVDRGAPVLLTKHWMVSEHISATTCGGAHPNYSVEWKTWDLRAGKEANVWSWFSPGTVTDTPHGRYNDLEMTDAIRALLAKGWTDMDEDCKEMVDSEVSWQVRLTRTGLAFTPNLPHVGLPCVQDVHVSFKQIEPLLNTVGKAGMASFRADLANRARQ